MYEVDGMNGYSVSRFMAVSRVSVSVRTHGKTKCICFHFVSIILESFTMFAMVLRNSYIFIIHATIRLDLCNGISG